jgi:membrane-associated phospholipid phosphatase
MPHAIARTISILGHPLVTLPIGVLLPSLRAAAPADAAAMLAGFLGFALAVMLWSRGRVRSGQWAHIDASHAHERRSLNRFLLPAILIGTALAWLLSSPPRMVLALAASAGIVLAALLLSRWCKPSLHVAFAVLATGLLWPLGHAVATAMAVACLAIAWSRLRLARHTATDLVAGGLAGVLAATATWALVPRAEA